jgi:hypothetical protein
MPLTEFDLDVGRELVEISIRREETSGLTRPAFAAQVESAEPEERERSVQGDRREAGPPVQVETATWSKAGQLDWRVKELQEWWGRVRACRGPTGGSELLIFVS